MRLPGNEKGSILAITTGFVLIFTILGFSSIHMSGLENMTAEKQISESKAFWLAEAGIQKTLWVLDKNPALLNNDQLLASKINTNNSFGDGGFQVQISGGGADKTISSLGSVYSTRRRIQIQASNDWSQRIPAALYSSAKVENLSFNFSLGNGSLDGHNKTGIYAVSDVDNGLLDRYAGKIKGTPPVIENTGIPPSGLEYGIWDAFDFDALRERAKADGTYFSGDYNNFVLPIETGVFFFDTTDGKPLTKGGKAVDVWFNGTNNTIASGIIIVVGDLTITDMLSSFLFDGIIFVMNDLTINDIYADRLPYPLIPHKVVIRGALLIDNNVTIRNSTIEYSSAAISDYSSGFLDWFIVPGSWQEL